VLGGRLRQYGIGRTLTLREGITRNKLAQSSVRTPASPAWRSMMRPKVFHDLYKQRLPKFMRHSRLSKIESITNLRLKIQIVDTHESHKTPAVIGFSAF
jgi:hypothetical protein